MGNERWGMGVKGVPYMGVGVGLSVMYAPGRRVLVTPLGWVSLGFKEGRVGFFGGGDDGWLWASLLTFEALHIFLLLSIVGSLPFKCQYSTVFMPNPFPFNPLRG